MKRTIFVVVFVFINTFAFSQNSIIDKYNGIIDFYLGISNSFLGQNEDFIRQFPLAQRVNRNTYKLEDNFIVILENGIINLIIIGESFNRTNEAFDFLSVFYNYFENNKWEYIESSHRNEEIFFKNGIYAIILQPSKRDDGLIAAAIFLSKKKNPF